MKIQYCSDLHLEFPKNKDFLRNNPIEPIGEVLILAGDIVPFAEMKKHMDFFKYLSDSFKYVFWVPGNHEYYFYELTKKSGTFTERLFENFYLLNNSVFEHKDIRFIFSTLWTQIGDTNNNIIKFSMSDFRVIKHKSWPLTIEAYNNLHADSLLFLQTELKKKTNKKTIVSTHHVPTFLNYPPQYKGDALNDAFAVELFDFIDKFGPDVWIYGHHHQSIPEFNIGKTILINNQLGYVEYEGVENYNSQAIIEL